MSFAGHVHHPNVYSHEDLPRTVVRALHQGSNATSLDFHPQQQTILLGDLSVSFINIGKCRSIHNALNTPVGCIFSIVVGTSIGDITIWEVGSRERIAHRGFKVLDTSACPMPLQVLSVKKVWTMLLVTH